jgi:hypothetical protein
MPRKTKQQKGKGLYDKTVNYLFNAKLRDGEIHAPVWTKDGLKFGSFIGPGSDIIGRVREGIQPVSNSDRVAQAHDLRYGTAKTPADVRDADTRMINKLNDLQSKGDEYKVNIWMGKLPIQLKMFAEDRGIIKPGSFSSMKGWDNADDAKVASDKLAELEQQGYGKKKPKAKKPKKKAKPKAKK